MDNQPHNRLNARAFGLALGIWWAIGVLFLGLAATYTGLAEPIVALIGSGYIGYEATLSGTLIGTVWGFCDGVVGGFVFAWLYNWVLDHMTVQP